VARARIRGGKLRRARESDCRARRVPNSPGGAAEEVERHGSILMKVNFFYSRSPLPTQNLSNICSIIANLIGLAQILIAVSAGRFNIYFRWLSEICH
jgi:hypothetical protein